MTLGDEGTATAAYLISDSADESKTGTKKQNMSVKLLVSQLGFVKKTIINKIKCTSNCIRIALYIQRTGF